MTIKIFHEKSHYRDGNFQEIRKNHFILKIRKNPEIQHNYHCWR